MTSEEARAALLAVGLPTSTILRALRIQIKLSDFVLSRVVGRSAQTVRRWRSGGDEVVIPDQAAAAIDDLRTIAAMLLRAEFDGATIKSFLLSRNTGLGQDRPLDGVRAGLSAFRRVEHVTECFIAGVAPEPGSAFDVHDGEEFEPAFAESPVEPDLPHEPVNVRS
jgi:DNA-binding transcriptional regulator YiaG